MVMVMFVGSWINILYNHGLPSMGRRMKVAKALKMMMMWKKSNV
jgi:hypothetical protein